MYKIRTLMIISFWDSCCAAFFGKSMWTLGSILSYLNGAMKLNIEVAASGLKNDDHYYTLKIKLCSGMYLCNSPCQFLIENRSMFWTFVY